MLLGTVYDNIILTLMWPGAVRHLTCYKGCATEYDVKPVEIYVITA